MNLYIPILSLFLNRETHDKYHTLVNEYYLKINQKELYQVFQALHDYWATHTDPRNLQITPMDLAFHLYTIYPTLKQENYNPIFEELKNNYTNVLPTSVEVYLESLSKQRHAVELAQEAILVSEGKGSLEKVKSLTEKITTEQQVNAAVEPIKEVFVNNNITQVLSDEAAEPGLYWALLSLNKSLGPLRQGNFGFLFARPETGKTTFLAHNVTHMAKSTMRNILWFNNEEAGANVLIRCYQAAFGITLAELHADPKKWEHLFQENIGQRLKIKDEARISRKEIELLCAEHDPTLIIFDQIDKIDGFEAERYDLKMKSIYNFGRELSKTYGPVIGVCQAGSTGEGKKWLGMNDVDSSHTAKQGEADWMLGIGKTFDDDYKEVRYLHLSKNKLHGDKDSDPSLRHGKWETRIIPEIAQYADFK